MRRSCLLVLIAMFLSSSLADANTVASVRRYWIEFSDKGIERESFIPGNPLYERTLAHLSARARARRAQALGSASHIVTLEDAPLCSTYLSQLSRLGIVPTQQIAWENAISADLTPAQFDAVSALPFVRSVHAVLAAQPAMLESQQVSVFHSMPRLAAPVVTTQDCSYDSVIDHYGYSDIALGLINVRPLHAMGFSGAGVNYGILDCGFNWREMRTTKHHRVHGEYDFVFHDSVTANQPEDWPDQDGHGSLVLSTATGYLPDSVIGPAYDPDVWLAKTEDIRSETPREEDNYAAALEWMESQGVEITSSSLGYRDFDSGFVSYNYVDLDGGTTISSRAAARAARLGVLVCTASGNNKQTDPPSLMTPSDADSILSCGALMYNDTIADFSSNGPSADGRIKPDISAPGVWIATIHRDDSLGFDTGTSLATPLVSGACVLIKQAHPEATAMQIRDAVLASARHVVDSLPNNVYGYGEIDAYNAALKLGTIIGPVKLHRIDTTYSVCVPIAANNGIHAAHLIYSLDSGSFSQSLPLSLATDSLIYSGSFVGLKHGTVVQFYVEVFDGADTATHSPRTATHDVYTFTVGDSSSNQPFLDATIPQTSSSLAVYPNPASDYVMIRTVSNESTAFELGDAVGRVVASFTSTPGEHTTRIMLGSLTSGTYYLRGRSASGIVSMRSIVVAR